MGSKSVTIRIPKSLETEVRGSLIELLEKKGSLNKEEYMFLLELSGLDPSIIKKQVRYKNDEKLVKETRKREKQRVRAD